MESDLPNLLGHLGYVLIAAGMLCLVKQMILGWVLRILGESTWCLVGVMLDMSSLWLWAFVFASLDIYGYFSWKKKQKHATEPA